MKRTPELTAHFEAEFRQASPAAQARFASMADYVQRRYDLLTVNVALAKQETKAQGLWPAKRAQPANDNGRR